MTWCAQLCRRDAPSGAPGADTSRAQRVQGWAWVPTSTSSSSEPGRVATPVPCGPPSSGSRSVWSRRESSAAPASTSAASRPRRCCTPPRSPTAPASPSSSASGHASTASTWPASTPTRTAWSQRLFKGLTGLIKGRGITVIEGAGRLTGPREVTVDGTAYAGRARRPGLRLLPQVAARPRHRRRARPHLRGGAAARPGAGLGDRARRRRDRLRVRQRVAQLRRRGDHRRGAAAAGRRWRTRRPPRRSSGRSASAGSRSRPARRSRAPRPPTTASR